MYLCILDQAGTIVLHKNIKSRPEPLLRAVQPYREGLVIGCECTFTWYWLGHIYNTHLQYNVATPTRRIRYAGNREALTDPFADESVKKMIAVDLSAAACYDRIIKDLELYLTRHAKVHDPQTYFLLQTVAGIGKVLALTLLYEIHDVHRFADVGEFISYSRLVNCPHTSAGKLCGSGGRKIGNAFIRWAFAEAVCLLIRWVGPCTGCCVVRSLSTLRNFSRAEAEEPRPAA
jgi:hypothetical protein